MPCYQMNLINVEFKIANVDFLIAALVNLKVKFTRLENKIRIDDNWNESIYIDLDKQTVEATRSQFDMINNIKREYSRTVLTEVAKKKRWIVKKLNNRNFQIQKY